MQNNSSAKILAALLIAPLLVGIAVGWVFAHHNAQRDETIDTAPITLSIQRLGDLHTVAFHELQVMHFTTERSPQGWFADMPGVSDAYRWATRNRALVVAQGNVEAGIDLSKLHAEDVRTSLASDGSAVVHVHLPPVTIYPPNVKLDVERVEDGPFWRDDNLVPKAQEQAGTRFVDAAKREGIIAKAQAGAIDQVRNTLQIAGLRNVVCTF